MNTIKLNSFFAAILLTAGLQAQTVHERLIWGTGEYSPQSNWHGILQFDRADTMNSSPGNVLYTPSSTIPVKQCSDNGVNLNFAHGFYYRDASDELYTATLFDNSSNVLTTNPDTAVGSIAIFSGITGLSGPQSISRRIFGPLTQLRQPHACWVDETRDILYVANTFGSNVLVFDSASTIDGNRAPDRVIPINGSPVYIFADPSVDRIFVTVMPGGMPGSNPRIEIFNNASAASSATAPNIRIEGPNTRLNIGNMTIHNAWFRADKQLLAIGHHTSELLMFDLRSVNWGASPTQNYDLSPRVIIVADTSLYGQNDINLYGLFWDIDNDRMYCSVGIDNPGGGPMPGTPPTAIKVYDNVSDSTVSGFINPSKTFMWSNSNTYYPPQPLWLKKTTVSSNNLLIESDKSVNIYPQPANDKISVVLNADLYRQFEVFSMFGQKMTAGTCYPNFDIDLSTFAVGIYLLRLNDGREFKTIKFIKS